MRKLSLNRVGIGPINVGLPKEAVSGKVPAWVILASVASIAAAKLFVSYINNKRECETKERIAALKKSAHDRKTHCQEVDNSCETASREDQEQSNNNNMPDWVDGAMVEDKKMDSTLLGQSGAIVLIKGREGSGKSTLVIQLLIEACEGLSSNLFPQNDGARGPEWTAFLYASEAAPKFRSNFGEKLKTFNGRFKALVNNFNFGSVEQAVTHIRKSVMEAEGNCVVGIDNITDMFPNITDAQIKSFIKGLKEIRRAMNECGREVTFVIVTHANRVTQEAAGSALWQNLSEVVLSIEGDKRVADDNLKTIHIEKSRLDALQYIPIRRTLDEYMHFECYSEDEASDQKADEEPSVKNSDERLPLTEEVEDFFASIYIPYQYGYGHIYEDYKDKYQISNRDSVRNAIDRSKERTDKVA